MNAIQKFKEGRKILKGQYGLKAHEVLGGRVNGEIVAYVNIPGKGYLAVDGKGNAYRTVNEGRNGEYYRKTQFEPVNLTNYDRQHIYKAATRDGGMTSFGLAQASRVADYWAAQGAPKAPVQKKVVKPSADASTETPVVSGGQTGGKPGGQTGGRVTKPNYGSKFSGMNFSDDEIKYMTDAGFDPTNAKSVQEFILSKASNANLGARKGAGIADGLWGDKSVAAFQALRNQGIFTPKVDEQEEIKPVNETPIDAPDFGYFSPGEYSLDNAKYLKENGVRDWSSLVNYAGKNKESDFTKLLSGYFGTDDISQWDRKKLEGEAKIHGGYHGQDRAQLQGFLAGLQRKNNDQYQARKAAYQQIASTPDMQRQLGMQKFMLGNVGANTLGNQPGFEGTPDAMAGDIV